MSARQAQGGGPAEAEAETPSEGVPPEAELTPAEKARQRAHARLAAKRETAREEAAEEAAAEEAAAEEKPAEEEPTEAPAAAAAEEEEEDEAL